MPLGRDLLVGRDQQDGGFILWQEVLAALTVTSAKRPQVWIIEDIHVADLPTLQLLVFLATAINTLGVVIAVTLRPPPDDAGGATRALARLVRSARAIELGPLSPDEVATLTRQIVDRRLRLCPSHRARPRGGAEHLGAMLIGRDVSEPGA